MGDAMGAEMEKKVLVISVIGEIAMAMYFLRI